MDPTQEIDMSELTTMVMAERRQVALDSQHPARATAYDLALEKRRARRAWLAQRRLWLRVSARRQAAISSGC